MSKLRRAFFILAAATLAAMAGVMIAGLGPCGPTTLVGEFLLGVFTRLFFSTGNINVGSFTLYGVKLT